ncbi:Will die slowly protein [Reticulomyxa filosa]|uniref:Will die slowly protein n=1 Tax=Reticulomyxa filosa TaxID=46433 RepID=X6NLE6_RETFI|nr:Will die slowly protein [Reticulomyxa filosa]|eukprot:ETO26806.1 Will die slowly protein [Reticulomyxa filosa]
MYSKDIKKEFGVIRLWDIRSDRQIRMFKGHTDYVNAVEYSPFVVNNKIGDCSNIVCSGSYDNTIRFWDIRSNKNELYVIKGNNEECDGISCLKFLQLKKNEKKKKRNNDIDYILLADLILNELNEINFFIVQYTLFVSVISFFSIKKIKMKVMQIRLQFKSNIRLKKDNPFFDNLFLIINLFIYTFFYFWLDDSTMKHNKTDLLNQDIIEKYGNDSSNAFDLLSTFTLFDDTYFKQKYLSD